jgi:hypothetical protein
MIKQKQIENIGKFLWDVSKLSLASGAFAGFMMQNIPVWKVILTTTFGSMVAIFAFVVDFFLDDQQNNVADKAILQQNKFKEGSDNASI